MIEIDGASNRGIDEIRELRENVRYTPAKNRYKIYIIDEVHMLTREAFNALLKTLEEPPSHIIFIFATTEPHKIPPTILSRCQRYDFKRIPLREIVSSLKRIVEEEKVQMSQRGIFSIAQESEGGLRDAQSLLDQVISYGGKEIRDEDIAEVLGLIDQKILYDTIEAIASRDAGQCLEIVEHVYHYGYDLQHFCREILQYLRNLILIKVSKQPEGLMELPEEELAVIKGQADKFQFDQLNHLFNLLIKGEEEVAQSAFPRTMLEMTFVRMATFKPILPIDEILKKLERMETGYSARGIEEPKEVPPSVKTISSNSFHGKRRLVKESRKIPEEASKSESLEKEEPLSEMTEEMRPNDLEEDNQTDAPQVEKKMNGEFQNVHEETWKGLLDFARAKNPILGSFLALGTLIRLNGEKIELGFEKDSFHYDRILEKENRSQLELICHEYLQRKARVIISPLEQDLKTKGRGIIEKEGLRCNDLGKREEKEAKENPLIQEALRLFNGKIVQG